LRDALRGDGRGAERGQEYGCDDGSQCSCPYRFEWRRRLGDSISAPMRNGYVPAPGGSL
jgi:hypothetical protein